MVQLRSAGVECGTFHEGFVGTLLLVDDHSLYRRVGAGHALAAFHHTLDCRLLLARLEQGE